MNNVNVKQFSGYLKEDNDLQFSDGRETICQIEHAIAAQPNAKFGDDCFPLHHHHLDGIYVREIFMPAGYILTSKIHRKTHPYFIMTGDVEVLTENGMQRVRGPYWGITRAGTKRVILTHSDCVWVTCHATEETDLKKIEAEIIAPTFADVPEIMERRKEIK